MKKEPHYYCFKSKQLNISKQPQSSCRRCRRRMNLHLWYTEVKLAKTKDRDRRARQGPLACLLNMCRQPSSLNPPPPPCSLITLKVHSLPVSCTPRSCLRFLTQCQETDIMRPTRDCWAAPLAFADSTFFFIFIFFPLLANFCAALLRRICTA